MVPAWRPAATVPPPTVVARTLTAGTTSTTPCDEATLSATYLDELLAGAHRRVAEARARRPLDELRAAARERPDPPSFRAALAVPGVSVIAEIKRASPSKGPLAPGLDASAQARAYLDGGAAAVSVLTEPDRFHGCLDDLADVAALGIPALRKDFVVDRYQLWEARLAGASAVLLIVAALDERTLTELHDEAALAGLDVLVEVHDADEVEACHRIGATIVGVNARDLRTFELDPEAFARLRPQLPVGALAVAESGVKTADDVRRAAAAGADAVLVGESLVTTSDARAAVAALVAVGRSDATAGGRAAPDATTVATPPDATTAATPPDGATTTAPAAPTAPTPRS